MKTKSALKEVIIMNDVRTRLLAFKEFMNGVEDIRICNENEEFEETFKRIINNYIDDCLELLTEELEIKPYEKKGNKPLNLKQAYIDKTLKIIRKD